LYLAPQQINYAIDLAAAKTVISFGAPLLDGWGTPGNVFAARSGFRLVQIEPVESRTAALADVWLAVKPGTEATIAAALVGETTPADAARATGADEQAIGALQEAAQSGRAVVVAADPASPLMSVNAKLGAMGRTIVARQEAPVPESWKKAAPATQVAAARDRSIRVLLIDESLPGGYVPWSQIEPKLAANATVVVFSSTTEGYARHAKYVLPSPVFPEAMEDIGPAIDTTAAVFRLAAPLVAPVVPVVTAGDVAARLAGLPKTDAMRERAGIIHKSGRGTLLSYADAKSTAAKDLSADDFWKALNAGGCWMDDAVKKIAPEKWDFTAAAPSEEKLPLVLVAAETHSGGLESPLMSKVERESNLRMTANCVALSPGDARASGIETGARCILQTACGRLEAVATIDANLPLGVAAVSGGPRMADLCGGAPPAAAKVVRA